MPSQVTAVAHSNIALVKYWGKRMDTDVALNLPAVGSISMTLGGLSTTTSVQFDEALPRDEVALSERGKPVSSPAAVRRIERYLDLVRRRAGSRARARVESDNDFPTGAGLASSASGFAALALAGTRAAGLELSTAELSQLARQGSGSAARSLLGGFVELHKGVARNGADCYAEALAAPEHWDLSILVVVTSTAHKEIGSTEGMNSTAKTSPYYEAWIDSHPKDLALARRAIAARDFEALAQVTEASCLTMHGLMLSSRPGLVYWNDATVRLIHEVRRLRRGGLPCCFTIDAGPQVKVVCDSSVADVLEPRLKETAGVVRVIRSGLGSGARVV